LDVSALSSDVIPDASFTESQAIELVPQESRLSKKLSESNQKNIILLVLAVLFSIPFFNYLNYLDDPDSYTFSISLLQSTSTNSALFTTDLTVFIDTMSKTHHPVLYVLADGFIWRDVSKDPDSLRPAEKEIVSIISKEGKEYFLVVDNRYEARLQAGLGMGQTAIVIVILAAGSLALTKITIDLVITPIEAMMEKIKRIGENPLKAAAEEENEQLALEEEREGLGQPRKGEMLETEML
jgi:hypothetical protein